MKKNLTFEVGFCESIIRHNPDYLDAMEMLAELYTQSGQIREGLELDERIVALRPDSANAHYNLACSLALSHHIDEAITALRTAMEKGYHDLDYLAKDPDLRILRDEPQYLALMEAYKSRES